MVVAILTGDGSGLSRLCPLGSGDVIGPSVSGEGESFTFPGAFALVPGEGRAAWMGAAVPVTYSALGSAPKKAAEGGGP